MVFVVLAHNTNEDGWEASYVFNTVFKSIESAKAAVSEDASYMSDDPEDNKLGWIEDLKAFSFEDTILYRIIEVEIEQ